MNGLTDSFLHVVYSIKLSNNIVDMINKNRTRATRIRRPISTSLRPDRCAADGERMCEDGSCIARVELCPEEQLMNQNTILIMIVVGLAVVVFLVILYCFQQRQRRADRRLAGATSGYSDECDNESLYAPPPAYEEVINSDAFPATPEQRRLQALRAEEPTSPMTPPPNYASALIILAQSQESISSKQTNLIRRSVSMDQVYNSSAPSTRDNTPVASDKNRHSIRRQNIFRFSRRSSKSNRKNTLSVPENSPSIQPPPPYPDSPLLIPDYPPPPPTPLPSELVFCESIIQEDHQVPTRFSNQQSSNDNDIIA